MEQLPQKPQGAVKGLIFYVRDIIRFHDVGVPRLVEVLFVLTLAVLFGSVLLISPYMSALDKLYQGLTVGLADAADTQAAFAALEAQMTPERVQALAENMAAILGVVLGARLIASLLTLFYGYVWHLGHLTPGGAPIGMTIRSFLGRLPRLAAVNGLFFAALLVAGIALSVVFGVLSLFIPLFAVVLYIALPFLYLSVTGVFAFRNLSVLSGGTGVFAAFRDAWRLTAGSRKTIIGNMVLLYVLGLLVTSLAGGNSAGAPAAAFVVTFLDVIMMLVTQRLVVRMYEDARGVHGSHTRNP